MQVDGEWVENVKAEELDALLSGQLEYRPFTWPRSPGETVLLRNVWKENSASLEVYKKGGGYAGLADQVDFHTWKLLKGVALATVLGVGSELVFGSSDSDLVKALQQSTQATTNRAGQRLIERQLNVQPTITVRPGWPLRVIVHKDIVFR